ncbi:putative Holliday junction resolvase [Hydrogenivirga caldilitoris]|uniref:Putative pre-16S rRNA nuclease n=1 Tax=Hydrogenivirga caldilitoris TaxID=246264 RepID=A0A497XNX1_9AQUI|nr:Holliday junction resolvase RuvX [Hydrogenivirga caldilitoris]RLJ70647.1 putative Holliday junction resolvase [Hydrogenivirga caldilitoris]
MKILAIDFGTKRVGIAVGDTELGIAVPKGVLKNDQYLIDKLLEIIHSAKVERVVVGLPLTPSGKEGERAKLVREFVDKLRDKLQDVKIELLDERYTSMEAERRLKNLPPKKRKEILDALSAQIILEDYLQSR